MVLATIIVVDWSKRTERTERINELRSTVSPMESCSNFGLSISRERHF